METLFDQYKELNINGSLICLEQVEDIYSYFCYPTNAKAIGFEGSIMYCFIEPYGEMVFACNPDTCADVFVYPLARTFEDFMRLILACGSTNLFTPLIFIGGFQMTEARVGYHKEVKTASFQGKSITVENLTPMLSPKARDKRKREIESCLYEVFVKYAPGRAQMH